MKSLIKQLQDGEITISKFIKELDNMEKTRTITPKLGEKVLAWDEHEDEAVEFIFLAKADGEFPYVVFDEESDYEMFNDEHVFECCSFKNVRLLPKVETMTMAEALKFIKEIKGVEVIIDGL